MTCIGQHLNVLSMSFVGWGNNILSPVIELSLSDIGRLEGDVKRDITETEGFL